MNRQQAAIVMAHIGSVHPQVTVTPDMLESWYTADLISVEFETGMQVAEFIIREDQRFPTPARFREVRRAVQRPVDVADDRSLPPDRYLWGEDAKAQLRRVRQTITDARQGGAVPHVDGFRSVGETIDQAF